MCSSKERSNEMNTNPIISSPRFLKVRGRIVFARSGRHFFMRPAAILCILLALSACDLSWLLGKSSNSGTPPAAPTGVTSAAGNALVVLSWSPVTGAGSYNIYWSSTSGFATSAGTKITSAVSPYTQTGLTNGTTYYYVVTAVGASGESAPSAQVNAIPSAGGGGGSSSLITSFSFLTSNNPALTQSYIATIVPPNVNIEVPYSVIQNQAALTPTVTMQAGYALTSPSGVFVPSTSGTTLVITNTSTLTITNYTLNVSVDPNSMAFLQLSNPFYYDTSGNKDTLTSSQYTLALAGATNTYTITFQTDAFTVPYNATVVQNIVTSRPVGFSSATVPYGSFATNLSAALGGAVSPYTVIVQSPNKSLSNTFTVQAARTKSNIVQLTDVSATLNYVFSYTTTQVFSDSTLSSFLGTIFEGVSSDTFTDTSGGSAGACTDFNNGWNAATNNGNTSSGGVSNQTVFTSTGGAWNYDYSTCTGSTVTPQVQINTNNSAINSLLAAPSSGYVSSGSATVDEGTSFTISSAITPPPDLSPVVTPIGKGLTLSANLDSSLAYTTRYEGSGTYYYTCAATRSLTIPITQTQTFTAMSYPEFQQIVVKFPLYDGIVQVAPNSNLVQSWSQGTNSTDWILTFVMVQTTSHATGVVANLQLSAESGTTASYTIAID
jgi:hypothetical protein